MATSIDPQSAQRYVDFDEYIDFQLQKARSGIKSTDILTALAGVATLVLAYLLVFVLFDHWVIAGGFGQTSRIVMLSLLGVLTVAWLVWRVGVPWVRQVNRLYAARMLEKSDPGLKNTLLNFVDLRKSGKPVPPEILIAIEKRAALGISRIDMEHAVDRRPLMRASYVLCAVVLLFCAYTLFSPKKISNSIWRALFPTAAVAAPTQTEILEVDPGDVEILARTQLEVTVDLRGEIPEEVTLYYSTADRRFVDEPLPMREAEDDLLQPVGGASAGPRQYRALITGENGRGILQDMTYRIVAGDAVTRDYMVTVNQPPSARVDEVRYEFPKYMELEARTQSSGHITAWEGTKVTLAATANVPVKSARLEFLSDAETGGRIYDLPMQIVGETRLEAQWTLAISPDGTYPRYYRIQVRNEKGEADPQPSVYSLTIRPDQPPEVTLLDPTRDLKRPANAVVPLMIQARDPDFKLSYLTLRIEKNKEPLPISPHIFDGPPQPAVATTFEWDLKQHDLKPGDTLTYWIEARDNRTPDGNRRNTPRLNINIVEPVAPEEAAEQLKADKQRQQKKMEEAARNQNEEDTPEPEPQPEDGEQAQEQQPQEGAQGDQAQPMAGEQGQQEAQEQQGEGEQAGSRSAEGQNGQGQEQLDPNGAGDVDALKKFLENLEKEQQQQGENQQKPQPNGNSPQGGEQAPDKQQQGEQPQQNRDPSQPNQPNEKGQGAPQDQPQAGQDGQQPSGREPMEGGPSQPNAGEQKQNGTGGEQGAPTDGQTPDGSGTPAPAPDKTGAAEQPMSAGDNKPGEAPKPDGADPAKASPDGPQESRGKQSPEDQQTQQGDPAGGSGDKNENGGQGSQSKPQGSAQQGEQKKEAADGPEKTGAAEPKPSGDPQRRDRTGEEQPTGTPKPDSNAQPNPQEGMKKEGGDPAGGDTGEGEPKSAQPDDRQGTKNPRAADPAAASKQVDQTQDGQPDQQRSEPSDAGAQQKATKRDGQPQGANETPKGEGARQGQRSEQPDGGEAGAGQKSDQGQSGSNERGPGDNVNQPGNKGENAGQPSGGEQGNQEGPGSKTQGEKNGSPSGGEAGGEKEAGESQSPMQGGGKQGAQSDQPGPGQQGDQRQTPDGKPGSSAAGDNPAGGHGNRPGPAGAEPPERPGDAAPPQPNQAEPANPEYGREAANLVLKKLQEQIERGEIDQEWLKETGWTEDQAKQFAERLKRHLNQDQPSSPEELARQRQFEEMLRTLRRPDVGPKRSGQTSRTGPSLNEIGPRRLPVPPEYRELYYEYRKSQAKRTTVPKD